MKKIRNKNEYLIEKNNGKGSKSCILWIFFLILIFLVVIFPIYGMILKYKTEMVFLRIFNLIGVVSVTLRVLVIVWGILMLFCMRSFKAIGLMPFGVVLLFFGSFFLIPESIGLLTHGEEVPRDYN